MWLEIETLTPVHVGTGELFGPLDYAIGDGRVGVADLGRLFRQHPERADAIGQRLADTTPAGLRSLSLEQLLARTELADEGLWRYRLPASEETLAALERARMQEHELRPVTKTPDVRAYLPGTAIKGAIRTALIYAGTTASPEWAKQYLDQSLRPGPANGRAQQVLYGAKQDPNHDLLRALMIGDTEPMPPSGTLELVQERVLSANIRPDRSRAPGNDAYKAFQVYLEGYRRQVRLRARVRILGELFDSRVARILGWSENQRALSFQGLCDAANAMSREVCDWELEYFGKVAGPDCSGIIRFYRELQAYLHAPAAGTCCLCLGRGAGWHKLTPGILIARHLSGSEFTTFRERFGLAAFGRFDRRDFVFPKSRKVIVEGERATYPLGWVCLRFSESEPAPYVSSSLAEPTHEGSLASAAADVITPTELPVPPSARSNPAVADAEMLIRTLKAREVKSRLQAVAVAIDRCPVEDRARLVDEFRGRLGALGFKAREIQGLVDSLGQRLAASPGERP